MRQYIYTVQRSKIPVSCSLPYATTYIRYENFMVLSHQSCTEYYDNIPYMWWVLTKCPAHPKGFGFELQGAKCKTATPTLSMMEFHG